MNLKKLVYSGGELIGHTAYRDRIKDSKLNIQSAVRWNNFSATLKI